MALTPESVTDALREVLDPEIGFSIVDLGLVYGVEVVGNDVTVRMTMTTPACPMSEVMVQEVEDAIRPLLQPGGTIAVQLVWDPPWGPERIQGEARAHFGWTD